jgi:hypothetical protein
MWDSAPGPDRLPIIEGSTARVPLTQGQVALIDAADAELIGVRRWCARKGPNTQNFYAMSGHRTTLLMHRVILGVADGLLVDHINHDTLDNRRANLRAASVVENGRNRRAANTTNTSGYHGVSFHRDVGKWRPRVTVDGHRHYLGWFATPYEAALARDEWVRANYPSEFWTFNFPQPGERGISNRPVVNV